MKIDIYSGGDYTEVVKINKRILILTDDSDETEKMAAGIAAALKEYRVSVKTASVFRGNDILPADVIFLGCEKPKPKSFSYLEDLFKHINLAGRKCGAFTPRGKATIRGKTSGSAGGIPNGSIEKTRETVQYLASIIRDSEAVMNPEPLFSDLQEAVKEWAQKVILN